MAEQESDPNAASTTPPPGIESNFLDPPSLFPQIIITIVVCLTLVTIFVGARAFVKIFIIRKHHIEDWLCYWAFAGLIAYTGNMIYIGEHGYGRHQWDITNSMNKYILYWTTILYSIYSPTTLPAKLSVLFQIKRIFTTREKNIVFWVVWVSIIANVIIYVSLFFSYVFGCWPRAKMWDPSLKGKCVNTVSNNLAAGILNLISDVEALLLPAWGIWHLNMPIKRKLGVFAVFGVGTIACIIGVVGIYFRVIMLHSADFTWMVGKASCLVISEMATVIIVGCFPSIPRLFLYFKGPNSNSKAKSYESRESQKFAKTKLPTLAKYMGPGDSMVTTTSNEHLELHSYQSSYEQTMRPSTDGILKTTVVEQSGSRAVE